MKTNKEFTKPVHDAAQSYTEPRGMSEQKISDAFKNAAGDGEGSDLKKSPLRTSVFSRIIPKSENPDCARQK